MLIFIWGLRYFRERQSLAEKTLPEKGGAVITKGSFLQLSQSRAVTGKKVCCRSCYRSVFLAHQWKVRVVFSSALSAHLLLLSLISPSLTFPGVQWELRWVTMNIFWKHVNNGFRTLFKNRSVHFSDATITIFPSCIFLSYFRCTDQLSKALVS